MGNCLSTDVNDESPATVDSLVLREESRAGEEEEAKLAAKANKEGLIGSLPKLSRSRLEAIVKSLVENDDPVVTSATAAAWNASSDFINHHDDIWVNIILAFLGPGHYIYVAPVCKKFKRLYETYFATIRREDLPIVRCLCLDEYYRERTLTISDTLYRVAFFNVPCAIYWSEIGDSYVLQHKLVIHQVTKHGNLDVLKWAHQQKRHSLVCHMACSNAARNGDLEMLKYLRKNRCKWTYWTCVMAAEYGHLDVLIYAINNECPCQKDYTTFAAAQGGHMEILRYLLEERKDFGWDHDDDYLACDGAAEIGDLECLIYLQKKGFPLSEETCAIAAQFGHLKVLKWLHHNGAPWDEETCTWAAGEGHLDILKYAHENGCPWDEQTCAMAAKIGCLECLEYAHENGCPWDWETCDNAAARGHLDIALWAYSQGCPWENYSNWFDDDGNLL